MSDSSSRRDWFQNTVAAGVLLGMTPTVTSADEVKKDVALWAGFPKQDSKMVAEVVGAAHTNLAKVKELVTAFPPLVNAWWDWGFGDWESPLGAASHIGQRPIAEYLLAQGARIDIFCAAMMGMTDVVKAFVKATPGIQKNLGPHGIPLLTHAKMGGKQAADTLAYLESLGDAGGNTKPVTLTDDEKKIYLGKYTAAKEKVTVEVKLNKANNLTAEVQALNAEKLTRGLTPKGNHEFTVAGVASVKFVFEVKNNASTQVTIASAAPILTAVKANS